MLAVPAPESRRIRRRLIARLDLCSNNATLCSVLARHIFSARSLKRGACFLKVCAHLGPGAVPSGPGEALKVSASAARLAFPPPDSTEARSDGYSAGPAASGQGQGRQPEGGRGVLRAFESPLPGRLCPRLLQALPAAFLEP